MAARARRQSDPEPAPPPIVPPPPEPGTFRLLELPLGRCRSPCSSNGSDHRFCGRPAVHHHRDREAVWCAEHLPVVFEARRPGALALRRVGRG